MHRLARPALRSLAVGLLVAAAISPALASGDTAAIAWRVAVDGRITVPPALGPDGGVVVQGFEVVVIEPDGAVRWRQDVPVPQSNRMCAVDAQGRIYAPSGNDLRAYGPDGAPLWTALSNPAGFDAFAGPSVGPDGNIYVLDVNPADLGGRGMVSLTPAGEVRWSHESPDWALASMGLVPRRPITFADGLALVSSPGMPADGGALTSGVMAFGLDGEVAWTTSCNTPHWVTPAVPGKVYLARDPLAFDILDTDDGSVTPVVLSPNPLVIIKRVAVGPDGTGYASMTPTSAAVRRLNPDGSSSVLVGGIGMPGAPEVSLDGSLLVVPTSESVLPSLNHLNGLDPATGEVLWSVPLPPDAGGEYPMVSSPPRFSADGRFVYLAAATAEESWVYAFELQSTVAVGDGPGHALAGLELLVRPGAGGPRFQFELPAASPATLTVFDVRGRRVATVIRGETLPAGETTRTWDPRRLASGVYLARLQVPGGATTARFTLVR